MTLIKKSPKKQSHLKTLVARRKARLAAETAFKSQEFVESDSEPEPENEAAVKHEELPAIESVPEDGEYNFATNDESNGFDIAAYEASITKVPDFTEEGFGEHGYEGLWLWYSEIEKFKSTTLAEFLKAREVPKHSLVSHTSYIGGRWFIPTVENNLFLSLYYRDCVRNGASQFISERQLRWRKFRFIVDWDMEATDYATFLARNDLDELSFDRQFAGVVLRSIGHLIQGHARLLYAKNPVIPNKVHIYFPSLLVKTADMGTEWLALIQDEFLQTFSVGDEDWDKIFDRGVLKNGSASLRMMGSQNDKRNGTYKPLDLITGQFAEITTTDLHDTILRTEIHMNDSPYKESEYPKSAMPPITSVHVESLRKYTEALAEEKPFPSQSLKFKDAKPGFFDHSFVVDLEDQFCSIVNRPHNRSSTYMYLLITQHGTWLKCYNSECHGKNIRLKDVECPSYITDLFPQIPEVLDDICGGGESDDETAVEIPKKAGKPKKRRRAKRGDQFQEDEPEPNTGAIAPDSDVLEKDILTALYNKKRKQTAFTAYLNDFVTYVHANDSFGFRHNRHLPFILGKKSTVANKLERYNSNFDAFNIWCRNDNRREFHKCVFDTSTKAYGADVLNLFKGYKARLLDEQISPESVEVFLYHIREINCSGNDRDYKFFLFWWAWMFQKGRTGVMVILMSLEKGTGKNVLLELIAEHIIGDQYVATTDKITTITQKFNALNAEKVLIIANELKDATKSKKEQKGTVEVLKTLIKDRTMTIEKKGIDPLHGVPSTTNYIGTSNNVTPVKIDPDQRRFFALKVSDAKKGNSEYFNILSGFVKENANEIFTFLSQIDLTGWAPEKDMPQTEYVKEIQAAFRNPIYLFWDDSEWHKHDFNAIPTKSEIIFKQYEGWCDKNRVDVPAFPWFGRMICDMGYTVTRETRYGDRAQWISGNMSENARTLTNAN